jgi:hypothetical protein
MRHLIGYWVQESFPDVVHVGLAFRRYPLRTLADGKLPSPISWVFLVLSRFRGGLCVTYKTGIGLDDWIYWHLIHTTRDYRHLQLYRWCTHFTVHRYALGFSVFTSRILAMSRQITHEVFFSQPDSFLAISSQSHSTAIFRTRPISWQHPTQMNSSSTELSQLLITTNYSLGTFRYIVSGRIPRKTLF